MTWCSPNAVCVEMYPEDNTLRLPLKAEIEQPVALHKVCACVFCVCAFVYKWPTCTAALSLSNLITSSLKSIIWVAVCVCVSDIKVQTSIKHTIPFLRFLCLSVLALLSSIKKSLPQTRSLPTSSYCLFCLCHLFSRVILKWRQLEITSSLSEVYKHPRTYRANSCLCDITASV